MRLSPEQLRLCSAMLNSYGFDVQGDCLAMSLLALVRNARSGTLSDKQSRALAAIGVALLDQRPAQFAIRN